MVQKIYSQNKIKLPKRKNIRIEQKMLEKNGNSKMELKKKGRK